MAPGTAVMVDWATTLVLTEISHQLSNGLHTCAHVSSRMYPYDFCNPLTFHVARQSYVRMST